jgi:anti-sigma factor RsiW
MRIWFPRRAVPGRHARSRGRSHVPALVCQQVVELVTDYLEGALPAADRRRFEEHLAGCPHCTEYLAQMRETIRLAGRLTPEDLTPDMRSDLTDLYQRWRAEG